MNAHAQLLQLIHGNLAIGRQQSLLLHCCCAPCATTALELLKDAFAVTAYFFNPNITEKQEYDRRFEELSRLAAAYGIPVIDGGFAPQRFFNAVSGLEREKEGGARCSICFALRLGATAQQANGYDYFATTLTLSPLKNAALLNELGAEAAKSTTAAYLPTDFKKGGGFLRSVQLSKEFGLYRQNYCGCVFSRGTRPQEG